MKLVFLGPPGAGKGTVAGKAIKDFTVPHVSTGDIFRAAIRAGTDLGAEVKSILASGGLVPDELTIALVRERLERPDARDAWILDGFPRTLAQADALELFDPPQQAVIFELGDTAVVERLSGRRTCPSCGRSFNVRFLMPVRDGICDSCGAALITRPDDQVEAIHRRLDEYRAQTAPLVDYYRASGRLTVVDASPGAEAVYAAFRSALG
ncbi:MAG TPA: nucleoside monophosphate kinase [Magnetospirillaceae bacterium]|nr:nucleoside monophosphate kinase [Magnetospirillaceae bacterium]